MPRYLAPRGWVVLLVCLVAGLAIAFAHRARTNAGTLVIVLDHDILPANGYATAKLSGRDGNGRRPSGLTWRFLGGRNLAELEVSNPESRLRAGVTLALST